MSEHDRDLSKSEQRAASRRARKALSREQVATGSQRIVRSILGTLPLTDFESVAIYWPIGNEVDLRRLASAEETVDLTFALPVVGKRNEPLRFRAWKPGDCVEKGAYGESIPVEGAWIRPQLLLMPLVGFDREGSRIGQGGGYYDRTLAHLRASPQASPHALGKILAVGVAFSVQECLNIAREDHDEPLDRVITERETIIF